MILIEMYLYLKTERTTMKALKLIIFLMSILNLSYIYCQEVPIEQEQKIIAPDQAAEEQDELKEWQNHAQSLLEKGMFWDSGNNVPTNDWKDTAFEIAKTAIQKNS